MGTSKMVYTAININIHVVKTFINSFGFTRIQLSNRHMIYYISLQD